MSDTYEVVILFFVGALFVLMLGGIFIALPLALVFGVPIDIGSGEHVGYVTAVETKGVIFKTPSAYFKSDAQSSQEDQYCAIESVVPDLKKYAESRSKVRISYDSKIAWGIKDCGAEGDRIIAVTPL